MFWRNEARTAADGAKAIHDVSQSVLADYRRSTHPSGEIMQQYYCLLFSCQYDSEEEKEVHNRIHM